MERKLKITTRDFAVTPAIEAAIRQKVDWLERFYDRIVGCEVIIEGAVEHHRHGGPFKVRVILTTPGARLAINRKAEEELPVALREAFDAARRRLEDHTRRMRGDVKAHEQPPHGHVVRLFEDHGFLEAADGREIYFHRNSVMTPGFEQLEIGREVRFAEEEGMDGPQASTVYPLRKIVGVMSDESS